MLLCFCLGCLNGISQDNNFWTQQYGNVSTFLGGAVVGTYKDNGSIYYNPATLAFTDTIKISFSAALYQANLINIKKATSDDSKQTNSGFNRFPISFYPVLRINDKTRLGLIFLLRNYASFKLHDYKNEFLDVTTSGIPQNFIGTFDNQNSLAENWYGLSISRIITPRSSIGLSFYGTYRYQTVFYNYSANAVIDASAQDYLVTNISHYFDYDLYQGIFKAGYYHDFNKFSFGITATLPSLYLFSFSRSSSSFYFNGYQKYIEADTLNELLVINEQTNNKARYKYPASLAIGFKKEFDKLTLFLTTEFYQPIDAYSILTLSDSGNITVPEGFEDANDYILNAQMASRFFFNVGAGFQIKLRNKKSIITGFSSDVNSLPKSFEPEGFNISTARNSLVHASTGMDFVVRKVKINGGIKLTYGFSNKQLQFVNMSTASAENLLIGNRSYTSAYHYLASNFFIGIDF